MPTTPDMSTDMTTPGETALLDTLQHQIAIFARRAEQTRLGGLGQLRNSMDRAAYLLLNRLADEGPMGVKALAASMGIDSSTVTRQVAPLVDTGLVLRTSHPEDGRAVVLELSERGRARLAEVRASRRELMAQLTQDWDPADRARFCELLTRLNAALSARQASQNTQFVGQTPGTAAPAGSAPSGSGPAVTSEPPQDSSPTAAAGRPATP